VSRDAERDLNWDFRTLSHDPVSMAVALIELLCTVVPDQPDLLLHSTYVCHLTEQVEEALSQLPDETRNRFEEMRKHASDLEYTTLCSLCQGSTSHHGKRDA